MTIAMTRTIRLLGKCHNKAVYFPSAGAAKSAVPLRGAIATNSMKGISMLSTIFIVSCASQQHSFSEPEHMCALDSEQKEMAWRNVIDTLIQRYPEHSKYCETEALASSKMFAVQNDECQVYLACAKSVNGSSLLHGDWIVTINEQTQEVIEFHDVVW